MHVALGLLSSTIQTGHGALACNSSISETEAGESGTRDHPQLFNKGEVSLGYK